MDQEGGDENEQGPKPRKGRTQIDLNFIWKLYNDSVEINGLSLSMLVRSRQNDAEGGACQNTSSHWLKKIMRMYSRRATLGFKDVRHLNMVCDASRHGVYECLVSVAYSRHNDIGCYPPTQSLRSSKFVSPGEIECDSTVERLLAEGSRLRMSAYRMFQALSHQIQLLTDHTLTLTSFLAPEEMKAALEPVPLDATRVVTGHFVRNVKKNGEEESAVSLLSLAKLPMLVIGMDQGTVGMACAAFLMETGAAMTHFYWDPYHRLVRDLKLATTNCPPDVKLQLQQGQLCGSYMFSINYKPFKTAGFHDEKKSLLNTFMETETQDCVVHYIVEMFKILWLKKINKIKFQASIFIIFLDILSQCFVQTFGRNPTCSCGMLN